MKKIHDVVHVNTSTVPCKGDEISAHPLVYLALNSNNVVICPYCSKEFVKDSLENNA